MSTINRVIILGRDIAAWLSAAAVLRALGRTGVTVEVVELPSLLSAHDVYASLPALEAFHTLLGFPETDVLRIAAGTFTLGQRFVNFSGPRPPFFHGYGTHGTQISRQPFSQFWFKARQAGLKAEWEDFSLNAAAAKQGRFFVPDEDINAFAQCNYGYHLNAVRYAAYVKAQALRMGALVHQAHVFDARQDTDGYVTSLLLGNGAEIAGDLFIDATGPDSLLLGGVMGVEVESWRQWFPCDRTITAAADPLRPLPSYSQVRALRTGCLHLLPTQDMTGMIYAFSSELSKDDEALQMAAVVAGLRMRPDAVAAVLTPGRRIRAWDRNVVAVGDAACVFDPLDNVMLDALQLGLAHLVTEFPRDARQPYERDDYNRSMLSAFNRLRDFQIVHYRLNKHMDEVFWDRARMDAPPDTLAYKIELFKARGIVPMYDDETFSADSWMASFIGHGLMPESYDPLVDQAAEPDVIRAFQSVLGFIRERVQAMPSQDAYLAQNRIA